MLIRLYRYGLAFARAHILLFGTVKFLSGLVIGIGLGIYILPILTAETGLEQAELTQIRDSAMVSGDFRRDLPGSDFLHWGEGRIFVRANQIWLEGRPAPGPDYRLYLTPSFVDSKAGFQAIKQDSVQVGPIRAFENFPLPVPAGIDAPSWPALVIWCERFSMFITAARLD